MLEAVGEYFDLKEIKHHRKMCFNFKSLLKSAKKFVEAFEKNSNAVIDDHS
jgi:hypothetical protein